jgi:hypothetical protein
MGVKVYNYECRNPECVDYGIKQEQFIKGEPPEVLEDKSCRSCDGSLYKGLNTTRCKLEGITGSFPGAADKWAQQHEEAARVSAKKNRDRNVYETEQGER